MSDYPNVRAVSKQAGYDRILVDGVDITFFRGQETVLSDDYELTEPFAYGPTTIPIPHVDANLEALGVGELHWIRNEARVEIQRVDDPTADTPTVLATDYRGRVVCVAIDGSDLTLEVGGEFAGPASLINRQQPLVRRLKDVGFLAAQAIATVGLHMASRFGPTTGIEIVEAGGGGTLLAWAQEVCSWSQGVDGTQRALMPTVWGGTTWDLSVKDTTTKHLTLFTDDARVVPKLRDDLSDHPNTFYGSGVNPNGVHWRNSRYPGVIQGPPPDFPNTGGTPMALGDTDADTDSGDGISVLNFKLVAMHYVTITETFAYNVFSAATLAGVRELQDEVGGLPTTGTVNPATWDALFDITATGYSLYEARIFPLVQDPAVRKFDYTANGSIAGINDDHDPSVMEVDRNIEFGPDTTKAAGAAWCRGQKARAAGKDWYGTIELKGGFGGFEGEWGPEDYAFLNDPDTGLAHLLSQLDIRPGMNAWLPMFDGGTLVHIAGARVNRLARSVILTVDTRARDYLELSAIKKRNAEAARNIRREWLTQNRPQRASGNLVERDEYFGHLSQNVHLTGDTWNVLDMVVGQSGTVNRVHIRLDNDEAAFSVAFLSRDWTAKRLEHRVGDPLVVAAESVWETGDVADMLRKRAILFAAGDGKQPCGYFPRRHRNDDNEVTDAPITGEFISDEHWTYQCIPGMPAVIRMAIRPDRDTVLKRGQILYAQADDVV